VGRLPEAIHRYFATRRHSVLLGVLIAAFAVRPSIRDTAWVSSHSALQLWFSFCGSLPHERLGAGQR
jgi:hypothetical protein